MQQEGWGGVVVRTKACKASALAWWHRHTPLYKTSFWGLGLLGVVFFILDWDWHKSTFLSYARLCELRRCTGSGHSTTSPLRAYWVPVNALTHSCHTRSRIPPIHPQWCVDDDRSLAKWWFAGFCGRTPTSQLPKPQKAPCITHSALPPLLLIVGNGMATLRPFMSPWTRSLAGILEMSKVCSNSCRRNLGRSKREISVEGCLARFQHLHAPNHACRAPDSCHCHILDGNLEGRGGRLAAFFSQLLHGVPCLLHRIVHGHEHAQWLPDPSCSSVDANLAQDNKAH